MSADIEGYCSRCDGRIEGYVGDSGTVYWMHVPALPVTDRHTAEPSELTLRRLYGDR